jgi:hypothetical protein
MDRRGECNDTLMIFSCDPVEFLRWYDFIENVMILQDIFQFSDQFTTGSFLNEHIVDLPAALNSLDKGSYAEYDVLWWFVKMLQGLVFISCGVSR